MVFSGVQKQPFMVSLKKKFFKVAPVVNKKVEFMGYFL